MAPKFVLGISGSPRIGGNIDIVLDRALEGARSAGAKTEKIILNALRFAPCQACGDLSSDGRCIILDQMGEVYEAFKKADAIIIGSPVYFGSVSAQAKMMIDRFQCHWRARHILKKPLFSDDKKGFFISIQATTREDFFANAKTVVRHFFAAIGIEYGGELACMGLEGKADVLKHPDYLKKAFALGQKIASA